MKRDKESPNNRIDWRSLYACEFLFKLITIAVLIPVFSGTFGMMLRLSGYRYLTRENVTRFLLHPLTIVCILLFLFLGAVYEMFEIGMILHLLRPGKREEPVFLNCVSSAWRYACNVLKAGKLPAVLIAGLLMLPFDSITMAPVFLSRTVLKDLSEGVFASGRYRLPAMALLAFGAIVFSLFKYTFFLFQAEDRTIVPAMEKSILLGKKHWLQDLVIFLLAQAVYVLGFLAAAMAGIAVTIAIEQLQRRVGALRMLLNFIVLTVLNMTAVLAIALNGAYSSGVIGLLLRYHAKDPADQEELKATVFSESRNQHGERRYGKRLRADRPGPFTAGSITWALLVLVLLGICGYYSYASYKGRFNPNVEYVHTMEVTAHRGASRNYPENTMAAFEAAVELGTDWIELDIQQSRDGRLFVMHDSSFRRTTGVRNNAWNMVWEDIEKLDAGSWFDKSFAGEKIPLLEDVIDFAKENQVRLNIELKPTGNEPDFEKHLVDLLVEKDFVEDCMVTSQVYSSLRKVKELDESILTAYVTSFAYGNINTLSAADYFSIKTGSLTDGLVRRVHNAGKQVLAWTVNSRSLMDEMIEMQVDNIITDDVALAKWRIGESRTTDAVWTYVRWLRSLFRIR